MGVTAILLRPAVLIRIEAAAGFGLAVLLYAWYHGSALLFLILFLVPDVSMLAYFAGSRYGAVCYNAVHTLALPVVLGAYGLLADARLAVLLSLIWFAHITADRALGFGLKYAGAFKDTHLQRLSDAGR